MSEKLLNEGKLLNSNGKLKETGYAKSLVKEYDRNTIKRKLRIKEWDYYYISNNNFGVILAICDNAYVGYGNITIIDLENKLTVSRNSFKFFPNGKTNFPSTSKLGDIKFESRKMKLNFENDGFSRKLKANYTKFRNGIDLVCDLELYEEPEDSFVNVKSFKRKKNFVYNQKINCMRCQGKIVIGGKLYKFNPENSFAMLNWSRGVWPYINKFNSASLSSQINGVKVGFSFSFGYGKDDNSLENVIFYNGKIYKIGKVKFDIPQTEKGKDDFMQPWKIASVDGKVNLEFNPIINKKHLFYGVFAGINSNQIFGRYTGTIKTDDKEIRINDLAGFAEKTKCRW